MPPCIDIPDFVRSSGSVALLSLVCRAFLEQLPPWQVAFDEAGKAGDRQALGELLHKMKGCCYAVSAHVAARAFEDAEHALATRPLDNWAEESIRLQMVMARMEKEAGALAARTGDMPAA